MKNFLNVLFVYFCTFPGIAQIKTNDLFQAHIYEPQLVPGNIGFAYSILDLKEFQLSQEGNFYGAEYNLGRVGILQIKNGKLVPSYDDLWALGNNGFYDKVNFGLFPLGNNYFATFHFSVDSIIVGNGVRAEGSLDILDYQFNNLYSVSSVNLSRITGRDLIFDTHGFGESIINGRYVVIGMEESVIAGSDDSSSTVPIIPGTTLIRYPAAILYDLPGDSIVKTFYFSDHKQEFPLGNVNWQALTDSGEAGPDEYDGFHINETSFDPLTADINTGRLEILFCLRNYRYGLVLVDLFSDSVISKINDTTLAAPHGGLVKLVDDSIRLISIHNNGFLNNGLARPLTLVKYRLNIHNNQFSKLSSITVPDYNWSQITGQYLPWRGDYYPELQDYSWVTVGGNLFGASGLYENINQSLRGILYYHDSIRVMDISIKDTTFNLLPIRTSSTTLAYNMHPIIWEARPNIICDPMSGSATVRVYPADVSLTPNANWYQDNGLVGLNFISPPFSDSSLYYFTTLSSYRSGIRYSQYYTGSELESMCSVVTGITKQNSGSVSIYPNPVSSLITLSKPVELVQVFTLEGKKVMETQGEFISVENLSKGVYLLRLKDNSEIGVSKIVKD